MLKKKIIINCFRILYILFIVDKTPLFSLSLYDIIELTLNNNPEILSAQTEYEANILSAKTLDGYFAPKLSFSSSASIAKDNEWNRIPDYFSSSITYSQIITGGTEFLVSSTYSFNSTAIDKEILISQAPKISFSLMQSLYPFWIQGKINDPTILNAKQQVEYYRYQKMYIIKNVLQKLIQNYAYLLIYKNEIQIYKNSILFVEEQISAIKELKNSGDINQVKITELESNKWNYEENLLSTQVNYYSCIQNIKSICGIDIEGILQNLQLEDDTIGFINNYFDDNSDPMDNIYQLKIQMMETNQVLKKQNLAPMLTLTLQPSWSLETVRKNDWIEAWKKGETPSWTTTLSVDLSSYFKASVSQEKKHYEINYEQLVKSYNNYLLQKEFIQEQYKILLQQYSLQLQFIEKLCDEGKIELKDHELLYNKGEISKIDYDSTKIKIDNFELSRDCIKIYKWLYEILVEMNK